MKRKIVPVSVMILIVMALPPTTARAQVNVGSTGSDGALDFSAITNTTNIVIDMHDHPIGIYNYTYVNIPANVTVSFVPNANNTPVIWLVQSNVVVNGTVTVAGQNANGSAGGFGGVGGWSGGAGGSYASAGQGPGGGPVGGYSSSASYGSLANNGGIEAPPTYGNQFLLPLFGGSGGGGTTSGPSGGGGGGGAIMIAASTDINVNGNVVANGGAGNYIYGGSISGGSGSGGGS